METSIRVYVVIQLAIRNKSEFSLTEVPLLLLFTLTYGRIFCRHLRRIFTKAANKNYNNLTAARYFCC